LRAGVGGNVVCSPLTANFRTNFMALRSCEPAGSIWFRRDEVGRAFRPNLSAPGLPSVETATLIASCCIADPVTPDARTSDSISDACDVARRDLPANSGRLQAVNSMLLSGAVHCLLPPCGGAAAPVR
jgi:hypothetical protein